MPSNIAHILIANAAYDELVKQNHKDFADDILYKNNHFYLGSLGPDLPSYKTSELVEEALNRLLIRPFVDLTNPQEEDASFFFHSTRPNLFPYYLMETNLSFAEMDGDKLKPTEFNMAAYVFTLGFVCHIAADQIVHRLVRKIVGPYYRSLETSQRHSDCEVHQDVFLFYELFPNRTFTKTVPAELINIKKLGFEHEQFCNMMSLAISKAGYKKIDRDDIDGWLNGIQTAFKLMDDIGPYVGALKNYEQQKSNLNEFPLYRKYFRDASKNFDYMSYFNDAVRLCIKYMFEIKRLWDTRDFSYESFLKYQKAIAPEDLTSPFRTDL